MTFGLYTEVPNTHRDANTQSDKHMEGQGKIGGGKETVGLQHGVSAKLRIAK